MRRSEGRILTSHTGRLFKPGSGWNGMGGSVPSVAEEQLQAEVTSMVRAQVEIGMDVVSNGQVAARGSYNVYEAIEGFETKPVELAEGESFLSPRAIRWLPRDMLRFPDFYTNMFERMWGGSNRFRTRMCVTGPLKLKSLEPVQRDLEIFKNALRDTGAAEGFFCVTAPAWTEEFLWNEYYRTDDEMVVALSEQMAPIYRAVVDAGVLLQIDDPAISHDWEEVRRPQMSLAEYEKFMMVRVEALNAALAGIPEEMVRYHVCWGSWPGMHTEDIPLKDIVKMILQVRAQAYSIEAAKTTHLHEWKVWRDVVKLPEGKILLPGVVDHTTNVVEHPEVIADRIITYAGVVGRENVIAATDCGMRGHADANWAKYRNIVKGAELASRQLWS
ncbi:MAG: epoxyalkane--coenzyme M transferase [Chloroflexi bacterium]|nr:epoxyalkane--coenzyme M transferase [Chloroflexota bacterium]